MAYLTMTSTGRVLWRSGITSTLLSRGPASSWGFRVSEKSLPEPVQNFSLQRNENSWANPFGLAETKLKRGSRAESSSVERPASALKEMIRETAPLEMVQRWPLSNAWLRIEGVHEEAAAINALCRRNCRRFHPRCMQVEL